MGRLLKILIFLYLASSVTASPQPDIESLSDGTVRIVARSDTKLGMGSGFIATGDGHVITNQHVIRGSHTFSVILNGTKTELRARIVAQSRALDLAILKVDGAIGSPLTISAIVPNAGEEVWALGFPGNADRLAEQVRPTITKGILSNVFYGSWHNNNQLQLIQHSAGISPGSSGGPLFDNCGRVVGVNSKGSGSRVLHDSAGEVVDVFAGTQIYFSSHIKESIDFLQQNGIPVSYREDACVTGTTQPELNIAEIDELRREIDAARAIAAQTGQVSSAELQRLESELAAAISINIEQERTISMTMRASIIAAASGIILILLFVFRSPVLRLMPITKAPQNTRSPANQSPRSRRARTPVRNSEFVLAYSNGYIDGEERVVLFEGNANGYVIGKHAELCDMVIDDPRLSARHVRLSYARKNVVFVEDLNSETGTTVSQQKIRPFRRQALSKGASFTCGQMTFVIK